MATGLLIAVPMLVPLATSVDLRLLVSAVAAFAVIIVLTTVLKVQPGWSPPWSGLRPGRPQSPQ
jgi:hypothetical protein